MAGEDALARGARTVDLTRNSGVGGTLSLLTPTAPYRVTGPDQEVTSCLVCTLDTTNDVAVGIDEPNVAVTTGFPIGFAPTPIPVHNLNQLTFVSDTNGMRIHIMWRQ